jgi:subtilisin family serine protease
LKNIDYTQLSLKGQSFDSLDIETKAQFIVDTRIAHAENTQSQILSVLSTKANIQINKLWIINAIGIKRGSKQLAEELASREDVEQIVFDQKYEISPLEKSEKTFEQPAEPKIEWNLEWVKSNTIWAQGATGKGKVVGLVDTGVNFRHPSLFHNYRGHNNGTYNHDFNWLDPNGRLQEPQDTQDHGSHCTGTVLGSTKDRKYITGAAYESTWLHCHFGGTFQAITKCFQFMLAPTTRTGQNPTPAKRPHVTSHSYGGGGQGRSLLEDVVKPCIDAGVHVVVAAHNYARCRSVTDPGIIPKVLTVGALGFKTNVIASFSSKGPNNAHYNNTLKPEISAPGTQVVSASGSGTGYSAKSGTSMATPLVAGVIAQLWSKYPDLDRQIAKTNEILYKSALHQVSRECESSKPTPNNVYGHGTISAKRAFEIAEELYGKK